MRTWILLAAELVVLVVLELTGHSHIGIGVASGVSLAMVVYNWPMTPRGRRSTDR